jgi:predicted O-methyltransferase YrrM
MLELAVLIPTRGRPDNIRKVISAWDFTNAWDVAEMIVIVDADDPELAGYQALFEETRNPSFEGQPLFSIVVMERWMPMVHKLNQTAEAVALSRTYFALGFAGDDHLPQTIGWAKRYLTVLHELGSGMVYGDDGYQGANLSTEWAVTADVVRELGRMVPADVEHMYCDNSIKDLFEAAGALRHLPEVRIEHMHPIVGKAKTDAQYQRVNHRDQFRKDRMAYEGWRHGDVFLTDVAAVRHLRPGRPEVRPAPVQPVAAPSSRRPLVPMRSGPTKKRITEMAKTRFPFSREFKEVRGATPDEIGMALADFATQVPADQEIVELGVFQGRTALIMAWGASQGNGAHVTAIDPWDTEGNVYDPPFTDADSRVWAAYRVRELGYEDRIQLVQAFSQDVAPTWTGKPVGLLYVDGDHTKEGARRDIELWAEHLAPGAIIAVDDYLHPDWPGVGQALDELVAEGFLTPLDVYHDRLAVTSLATEPKRVTTITSEGVSPLPTTAYPAVDGQVAAGPEVPAETFQVVIETPDTEVSTEAPPLRATVHEGELDGVAEGTPITELTIPQMKTLARRRNIVLGIRKDKRELIVQALNEGK